MDVLARNYTFEDMRLVSMFARLEGAPPTVEEIIAHFEERGMLSSDATRGAVETLQLIATGAWVGGDGPQAQARKALAAMGVGLSTTGGQ
jgi:hypothetical protein